MKKEFVPCKECIDCALDTIEGEPLYYCKAMKNKVLFTSIKEMINYCPFY